MRNVSQQMNTNKQVCLRKLLSFLVLLQVTGHSAFAQGVVIFRNVSQILGIDAPVFNIDCQTRLSGAAYSAQLYVGQSENSLAPVSPVVAFREGIAAGYVPAMDIEVEGFGLVYYQIRAWETAAGASYEEALLAGGKYGGSKPILVPAVVPPGGPGEPLGLEGFCLIPEPTVGALLMGGLAILGMIGRRSSFSS